MCCHFCRSVEGSTGPSAFVAFASIGLYQFLVASLMVGLLLGEMCSPLRDPDSGVLIFALFLEVALFGAAFATDSSVSRRLRLRAPFDHSVGASREVGTESEQLIKLRYQHTTFCDIYHRLGRALLISARVF